MELALYDNNQPDEPIYKSTKKNVIIGRLKDIPVDLNLLSDGKVSRPHAHLYYRLSTWWVKDLDSRHGTFLNGNKIEGDLPLSPGDELQLGDTKLRVEFISIRANDLTNIQLVGKSPTDEILLPPTISEDKHIELFSIFSKIVKDYPCEVVLSRFLEEIGRIFPQSEHRTIIVIDKDNELIPRVTWPQGSIQVSFTLVRKAIITRETLHWEREINNDVKASSLFDATAALCVPMLFNGRAIGAIYLDQTLLGGSFSETDKVLLSEVANMIATPLMAIESNSVPSYPSVFISYMPAYKEIICRLANHLRRNKIKVWFDERLKVGDDRQQIIATAIKTTDAFITFITPDNLESNQFQWELETALTFEKKILPITFETNRLPSKIEKIVPINISSGQLVDYLSTLVDVIYKSRRNVSPLGPQILDNRFYQKIKTPNRILILAANPKNTEQLRLDEEARTIEESLHLPNNRFDLQRHGAVQVKGLSQYLLWHKPNIIHFSGHGNKIGKVILEDETGLGKTITDKELGQMFLLFNGDLRCVVLNACLTASQANEIIRGIDCVVGMSDKIQDKAAIAFARGFYRAIADGQSVKFSYDTGCSEIGLEYPEEKNKPQLFTKTGIDPANIIFD